MSNISTRPISSNGLNRLDALRAEMLASGMSRAHYRNEIATYFGNLVPRTGQSGDVPPVRIIHRKVLGRGLSGYFFSKVKKARQ